LLRSLVTSELPPGSSVLDVGCGDGDLAVEVAGAGFQVTGIDLAPAPLEVLARQGVTFQQTSFEGFEPEGGRFDGIIMSHTLEHLPDPGLALRRAKELLAPSGRLFIELPNLDRPRTSVRRLCSVQHLWYFTPESLGHHLRLAGLRPVFERVFRVDCFQTVAAPAGQGAHLPSPDHARAERTAAILRRHRWLYYACLQFLWRKLPHVRRAIYFPFPQVRRPHD